MKLLILFIIFILTTIIGYKVVGEVPSLLHTPLMSGMNALSGITVLGTLTVTAAAVGTGNKILGVISIAFAMANVVGGFLVTHRMLRMFKSKQEGEF
ncbi:MAG TPA: NAD(P) transhydrogenase subunit alpha [Clostridiaceae bacterium]|nr:NAD(P) transhydrogenase subunit alpha [Clostridiaceae bacterium]